MHPTRHDGANGNKKADTQGVGFFHEISEPLQKLIRLWFHFT